MNNLEKFYEKKELYERFDHDNFEHFTGMLVGNDRVEIVIEKRISGELKDPQKEYVVGIIRDYIKGKQEEIEKKIIVELSLAEANAANQVIKDLKLRDIVWIKQECD